MLRGGYGIYYASIFFRNFTGDINLFSRTRTNYRTSTPNEAAFQFSQGFPSPFLDTPGASAGPGARLGQAVSLRESDATTPMTQQWNMSIQHQIGNWFFDATYAGNKGNHFSANGYNLNQVDPAVRYQLQRALDDRIPNPNRGPRSGRLGRRHDLARSIPSGVPHFTSVSVRNPRYGNYISHQLQFNVKRRMTEGLMLSLAFTGGKKIGDSNQVPVNFGPVEQGQREQLPERPVRQASPAIRRPHRRFTQGCHQPAVRTALRPRRLDGDPQAGRWLADHLDRRHADGPPADRSRSQQRASEPSELDRQER